MGKLLGIVVLLLGLAAVSFAVKTALTGTTATRAEAPARQLDNVRQRAHELEREQQQQVDEMEKKAAASQ